MVYSTRLVNNFYTGPLFRINSLAGKMDLYIDALGSVYKLNLDG
jgi:hypothetical protein